MTEPDADSKAFVDTNILVYAYDRQAGDKHLRAQELIADLSGQNRLVVSAQVLNELTSVLLRNARASRLAHSEVPAIVAEIPSLAEVVPVTGSMTFEALKGMERFGLSFWDALIWVAARETGARHLYSEDFQSGRSLDGVLFVNPFS